MSLPACRSGLLSPSNLTRYLVRCIATTSVDLGKRNFRKFPVLNKRGSNYYKRERFLSGEHDSRGVRHVGFKLPSGRFRLVPELVPELIVPDLTDTGDLKPYVSYRTPDVVQGEFTAQNLFDVVYANKIAEDFRAGKLDARGEPLEPSDDEKLTPEEAFNNARKTGSDVF